MTATQEPDCLKIDWHKLPERIVRRLCALSAAQGIDTTTAALQRLAAPTPLKSKSAQAAPAKGGAQ